MTARPTRRLLLAGAAAVPLAGCTGERPPPEPARPAPTPTTTDRREAAIFDLTFRPVDRRRPFALVAPGFVAVTRDRVSPGPLHRHDTGPAAPFAAVEVAVPAARGSVSVGLATDDDEHLLARWSADSSRVTLEARTAGRTRVLRRRKVDLAGGSRLAFALCENQVTVLVGGPEGVDGVGVGGWRPLLTERRRVAAVLDLRREEVLQRFRYAWGAEGVTATGLRAGLFGMTGLRDPHLVQHADGTPYERDGRYFLTWTCAGLGFFQQAHWTVWSFDPAAPAEQRLEAQLFGRRDGMVLGDHAGQLVRDGDRWLVGVSSWGDFAPGRIHVRHTATTADLLSGVHLLETEPTPLPTEHGSWDPSLTRVDGRWRVAFVESPSQDPFDFHPALAAAAGEEWHADLALVAAATDLHQCEGPILARVDGEHWLLASDGDDRHYPVFDLTGRRRGRLDAPYPTNIPHPQLVPDPAGGWWLVTFDGTQYAERTMGYGGHGDLVLMHSS